MRQLWLSIMIVGFGLFASPSIAQLSRWISPVDGDFVDPARWDTPAPPSGMSERAQFDRLGTYTVDLNDGATITLDDWSVLTGDVGLRTVGASPATIDLAGRLLLSDGDLTLNSTPGVSIQAGEAIEIIGAAELEVETGSNITSPATSIGGGAGGVRSELTINGATSSFGNTTVAGSGDFQGLLTLINNANSSIGDLTIAGAGSSARGQAQVVGSTLTQSPGSVTTVGAAAGEADDTAILTAFDDGVFIGATVRVFDSGTLLNSSSEVVINESLEVAGGLYREIGAATRTLAAGASLSVSGGGELLLGPSPLTIATGQSLELDDATITAPAGVSLAGGVGTVRAGGATLLAPVSLLAGAQLQIDSGATAVFSETFSNEGGVFSVASGGEAHFVSTYEGDGVSGGGSVRFESMVDPGQSPAAVAIGGDAVFTPDATLRIEIAGAASNEYDSLQVAGSADLSGDLMVELIASLPEESAYQPQQGDTFEVLAASSLVGGFDSLTFPALAGGLEWRVARRPDSMALTVVAPSIAGDYNHDGLVDAADYTVWRDTLGSSGDLLIADGDNNGVTDAADYLIWRSAMLASPVTAVPEPHSSTMVALLAILFIPWVSGRKLAW